MKVLKVLLVVFTLGYGSSLIETNLSNVNPLTGGPLTINSILAVNPAIIAVVGDYQYFLNCNKYKINLEKVQKEKEEKLNYLYPSCPAVKRTKVC